MTHRDIRSLSGALAGRPCGPAADGRRAPATPASCSGSPPTSRETRPGSPPNTTTWSSPSTGIPGAFSRALAHAESLLDQPRERALAALVEEANRHGAEPVCKRPTMGFPPACIPTCLYLLLTTDSFEEAITEVINLGGDTDTAGAILGALAGAYYGIDEIPKRWLDGLQNREGIDARAVALAQRSAEGLEHPRSGRHRTRADPEGRGEPRAVRLPLPERRRPRRQSGHLTVRG